MTAAGALPALTYLRPATATDVELSARFQPVFDRIAEGNVARERAREFPHEQVRWLKEAGLGRVRIPVGSGGFGASLEQTFVLLADLAEADPNVAHIWRNHLAFVEDRLNATPSRTNDRWIRRFLDGEFVGGGWTEANNGTLADLKTTVRRDGDRWRVTGAKFYATGSLYADWLDVLGKGDGGALTALVRRTDPGVELVDDWTGFGQRTTASGSATYTDALADQGDVFPIEERFVYQGHFYQTAMLSVLAGITRATLRDGIAALTARGRNYPHALDPTPRADAQLLQVVGQVSVDAFTAGAALRASSRTRTSCGRARSGRRGGAHAVGRGGRGGDGAGAAGHHRRGAARDDHGFRRARRLRRVRGAAARPALAQRAHPGVAQPAGLQGARPGRLAGQRHRPGPRLRGARPRRPGRLTAVRGCRRPTSPSGSRDPTSSSSTGSAALLTRWDALPVAFTVLGIDRVDGSAPAPVTLDSSAAGAVVAARTTGARFLVAATPQRDHPYNLARRVASLGHLSRGRSGVLLGVRDAYAAPGPEGAGAWGGARLGPGAPLTPATALDAARAVRALEQSWPYDSIVGDRDTGIPGAVGPHPPRRPRRRLRHRRAAERARAGRRRLGRRLVRADGAVAPVDWRAWARPPRRLPPRGATPPRPRRSACRWAPAVVSRDCAVPSWPSSRASVSSTSSGSSRAPTGVPPVAVLRVVVDTPRELVPRERGGRPHLRSAIRASLFPSSCAACTITMMITTVTSVTGQSNCW